MLQLRPLLLNGMVRFFPLPLNTLAPQSQDLAKQLGAPPPVAPSPSSSSPFDEILDEVVAEMPMDALGPEALDIDHDWTKGWMVRPLSAKFVSLVGDQLTIGMNGGAKEFTLPLSKFSVESQALAKVLQKVAQKHRPAPPKPAVLAKPVKVVPPKVVEADLDKMHTWTSADGRSLEATFVSADENGVDLKMRGRSGPHEPYLGKIRCTISCPLVRHCKNLRSRSFQLCLVEERKFLSDMVQESGKVIIATLKAPHLK